MFSLPGCNTAPSTSDSVHEPGGLRPPVFGNAEEEYVSIGDAVTVFDVAHPDEIDFRLVVAADGTVLLHEVGRIYIAGLTRTDLQSLLTRKYARTSGTRRDRGRDLGLPARVLGPG